MGNKEGQTTYCSECGSEMVVHRKTGKHTCIDPDCKGVAASELENTSGRGTKTRVPAEIKGMNWGAFWLWFAWGPYHKAWIALAVLVPVIVSLLVLFYLLFKGNEMAWRRKNWDSIEQFKESQHRWSVWGWGVSPIYLVLIILFVVFVVR